MNDWISRFRASVSWGDQITSALLPDGTAYCFVSLQTEQHAWVPGTMDDLPGAITRAQRAQQATHGANVIVMLLDQQATAAQVEETLHRLAHAGVGGDFLESEPRVLRDGLLMLASEGTLLDGPPLADA